MSLNVNINSCPALSFFKKGIATSPNKVATIKPSISANNDLVNVSILTPHFQIYSKYIISQLIKIK